MSPYLPWKGADGLRKRQADFGDQDECLFP